MIHAPSIWSELEPVSLSADALAESVITDEIPTENLAHLARQHPDSKADWHMIQALQALGRRNGAQGLAESHPSDRGLVESALATKRYWGRIAVEEVAAAAGRTIPAEGDIPHDLASLIYGFTEKYGQMGKTAIQLRATRIEALEARIRTRSSK